MQLLLPQSSYLPAANRWRSFRQTDRPASEFSASFKGMHYFFQGGADTSKVRIRFSVRHTLTYGDTELETDINDQSYDWITQMSTRKAGKSSF
jgi:hypothetical protein